MEVCLEQTSRIDAQTLWKTTKDFISPAIKFTNIIYHILTLHSGPITKFILSIPNLGNCPKSDNLMYFLSKNDIQDLVLYLPNENPYSYKLPSSFFTCLRMRHLALENCLLHPSPDFNGFDRLVSLELYEVTITSKLLECLVNRSPLLEGLVLRELCIRDHIQVNAANLRLFGLAGSIKSISFKHVPLLEKLLLWGTKPTENAGESDIAKWFESCPAFEYLHVNRGVVQSLAAGAGEVLTKLPCAFNCLRHLRLSDISLRELDEISGAFCLIRSPPYLHDVEIKVFNDNDGEIPALDSLEGFEDVTFNHLRTVKLEGITGTKLDIQLIKLLLAKSPVLVRMQIEPGLGDNSPQTRLNVLAELIKFRRASTEAEVVYNLDYDTV